MSSGHFGFNQTGIRLGATGPALPGKQTSNRAVDYWNHRRANQRRLDHRCPPKMRLRSGRSSWRDTPVMLSILTKRSGSTRDLPFAQSDTVSSGRPIARAKDPQCSRLRGGPHYHAATLKLAVVRAYDNYVVMDKSGVELMRGKPAVVL